MKKLAIIGAVAAALSVSSCDRYLDINQNPNAPSVENLTPDMLLPGAEMAFANTYGNYYRITGGYFAQHYAQTFGTSNYLDYSKFIMSASLSSSSYQNLCIRALYNLGQTAEMAEAEGSYGTVLAATVFRCAIYQALTDAYGEIPYSEAIDPDNITPKYDEGEDIYAGILAELDAALAKVTSSDVVATNFLLPGERADKWIQVANALKLRILMRESDAVNVKAELDALVAEDNFPDGDVAWENCWSNSSGQANPYYQEEFATYFGSVQQNVILNLALCNTLTGSDDPRLEVFFDTNGSGNYTGGVSGSNFSTSTQYKADYWCRPSMAYNSPVYLISRFEVEFFLAEYEARYGTDSAAKAHYEAAIDASLQSAGLSDSSTILAVYPWNKADYKRLIGVQKWVALSGTNNFEAWCEMRRLGYPDFSSVTGTQIYDDVNDSYNPSLLEPGKLYTPILFNPLVGENSLIQRWPYPESSVNRNSNAPSTKPLSQPVFWVK